MSEKGQEISSKKNQIKDMKLLIQHLDTDLKHYLNQQELSKSSLADSRQIEDEAKRLLNSSRSRGQVLSSLIKHKESDRIKGLYDRLVDSIEVGQTCIEYLKRNDLGRA
ncbi:9093_t:CDS:2 [Funneliformis caledonium]|uniref:9093_t:CDS:1 n=1 Tax=Funneliformis caledonium TaxID=1117310 RepID=A0A9N9EN73_9GLOM|nr:9093_t:CDS:2 [Funneliformis caledonium]